MGEVAIFFLCMVDGLSLVALTVYLLVLLSDLECDFLNTKQGCKQLNRWVMPEALLTAVTPVCLLLTWHWFLFLLTCPMAGYLVHRIVTLPPGSLGVFDPTEIRNRGMLSKLQTEAFLKIGYHLVVFFISLYCFMIALLL